MTHRSYTCFLLATLYIFNADSYDDIDQKCNNGEKIATFKRDSSDNESGRLAFTCAPLQPSASAIKNPKCEQGKPLTCNGETTGCPSGQWLGGITAYQLDTSGTPDLLVPTCCSAENVNLDQCSDQQLNSVNRKIDAKAGDNEVYQNFTCWPLVKSGRQKEDSKHLFEILYKVALCKYTVKVDATQAPPAQPPPQGQAQTQAQAQPQPQQPPKVGAAASNPNNGPSNVGTSGNLNSGSLLNLPVRGQRP